MWVRGLKRLLADFYCLTCVAPHVGAWIETHLNTLNKACPSVAPHVGAWIETQRTGRRLLYLLSHPMWVRGLKKEEGESLIKKPEVAPHVGAWIETSSKSSDSITSLCRTPCGCVD